MSDVTVNHAFVCLKIMLNRAVEMDLIYRNPAQGILKLRETSKERGILTLDEIKALFGENSLFDIWGGDLKNFTGTMLPLVTGIRQGEVLALQVQYCFKDHIAVMWSWSNGLVIPKWNSRRVVPIPQRTASYLNDLISESPFQDPEDLVFYGKSRDKPMNPKTLLRSFYAALNIIGIQEEQRRERNIVYHSLRHTFNTVMRGKVADSKLQHLTGHRTSRMVNLYTHWQLKDFEDVLEVQERYFS